MKILLAFLSFFIYSYRTLAQDLNQNDLSTTDSVLMETGEDIESFKEISRLDPQRSALLSALLPGTGQIYNKQYWKAPLVYGGLAAFAHLINYNNELYHAFRNAAIAEQNGLINPFSRVASNSSALIRNRDNFRRNRDYLIILGTIFYLLNVVDAHVSAHLYEFNVNETLTFSIRPSVISISPLHQVVSTSFIFQLNK